MQCRIMPEKHYLKNDSNRYHVLLTRHIHQVHFGVYCSDVKGNYTRNS